MGGQNSNPVLSALKPSAPLARWLPWRPRAQRKQGPGSPGPRGQPWTMRAEGPWQLHPVCPLLPWAFPTVPVTANRITPTPGLGSHPGIHPSSPRLGLGFCHRVMMPNCCVTLGKSLPSSGPQFPPITMKTSVPTPGAAVKLARGRAEHSARPREGPRKDGDMPRRTSNTVQLASSSSDTAVPWSGILESWCKCQD